MQNDVIHGFIRQENCELLASIIIEGNIYIYMKSVASSQAIVSRASKLYHTLHKSTSPQRPPLNMFQNYRPLSHYIDSTSSTTTILLPA